MNLLYRLLSATVLAATAGAAQAATFVGAREDFRDETIYFAMTTRFYDGDPTNNVCGWDHQNVQIAHNDPDWRGDFKGLIDKLDYIKALGFTAVWITPVVQNCSGTDFHGYHAMDFSSVDLRYESRTQWGADQDVRFQDLIGAAHAKGMKIILDIVLQHTGNFGEATLNPLFTRDQDIRNQGSAATALIPDSERLSSNYFEQDPTTQYEQRWKYFKNPTYEPNNYYHHYGTGWNWDLPNRWWGQIAGDCVDLNTENDYVAQYIVDCYGKFIEMGVDGFRIDTTGHVSRLTFNKQFIPQFLALGEKYKNKRLNGAPFFMFGECCARYSEVTYRDQPNLSSYFYTWKSPQALLDQYDGNPEWWRVQVLPEGHDSPVGPMILCEQETEFDHTSDNVFMKNGAWHRPDYSEYSGFSIIDFPMHYNFNNAAAAVDIAKKGDHLYNDASFNVVYVDSHDYCPGPNDGTRFNGGTAQWAENLSLMFSFRGIPCIYYGSEVEFKKGMKVDAGGTDNPVSESGRAYFGQYLEGTVSATDFGEYTANGNVAATLDGDLAQHIRRLNLIRAAVPALRKGQYTWDGCTALGGGWAFKRAYKDSYALVAINGGATFTDVPAGTYTDVTTGLTYNGGGTITVTAPATKGQLRVLVKDWTGGKIGQDGKFIYTTTPVAHGGNPTFDDPGASQFYTADDAIGRPAVSFSPVGKSFTTATLEVTASLNEAATSGWYKVDNQPQVALAVGSTSKFTIGEGMCYGESITVSWGAQGSDGQPFTGSVKYKKVDPNATITVYVKAAQAPNLYAWSGSTEFNGAWPGKKLTDTREVAGDTYYYMTFADTESINIIFNNGSQQTDDITGITEDSYFEYDGTTGYTKLEGISDGRPTVKFTPNGGRFTTETLDVAMTVGNATSAWYKIGDGEQVDATTSGATSFTIGAGAAYGSEITVTYAARNAVGERTGSVKFTKTDPDAETEYVAYFDNSVSNWPAVNAYCWDDNHKEEKAFSGAWPGKRLTEQVTIDGTPMYVFRFTTDAELSNCQIIFNGNGQTADLTFHNNGIYTSNGYTGKTHFSGVADVIADAATVHAYVRGGQLYVDAPVDMPLQIVRIDGTVNTVDVAAGTTVLDLPRGFYIIAGKKIIL